MQISKIATRIRKYCAYMHSETFIPYKTAYGLLIGYKPILTTYVRL